MLTLQTRLPSPATNTSSLVLNYIFVGVGFAVSALFLFRNLYPVLSTTDVRTSKILLVVVVALHAGLAIAIKILFFAHGSPAKKDSVSVPPPAAGGDAAKEGSPVRLLFGF
jgi:hypothetical protein